MQVYGIGTKWVAIHPLDEIATEFYISGHESVQRKRDHIKNIEFSDTLAAYPLTTVYDRLHGILQ